MINVGFIHLGCAKNQVDTELMLYLVKEKGYNISSEYCDCDVAVINTCAFIESAKKEAIENILEAAALKAEGRIKHIIVTGCLPQRYDGEIANEFPEVDCFIGTGSYNEIANAIENLLSAAPTRREYFNEKEAHNIDGNRILSTPSYWAYIKISEGCDNRCAYCAIPDIRGKFRSRTTESILNEAENLANNGVRELVVISQDTTKYGEDIYGKPLLHELLEKLCKVEGLEWIRVMYLYPDKITQEIIDTIADNDKIVKYIEMPIQHISNDVLQRMNRKGSKEDITDLVGKIRNKIPQVILRTTIITGFPGENDDDFTQLHEFIINMKFEKLGVFTYSNEEGTPASVFDNQIDNDIKEKRQDILMQTQMQISEDFLRLQITKTFDVLVEGYDKYIKHYFGRSYMDAPDIDGKVFFTSDTKLPEGDIVKVLITDNSEYDLYGEILKDE